MKIKKKGFISKIKTRKLLYLIGIFFHFFVLLISRQASDQEEMSHGLKPYSSGLKCREKKPLPQRKGLSPCLTLSPHFAQEQTCQRERTMIES